MSWTRKQLYRPSEMNKLVGRRIYKYPLATVPIQVHTLPDVCNILDLQVQNGAPVFWAVVFGPDWQPKRDVVFYTFTTGQDIESACHCLDALEYVGTYQLAEETLVYHVFRTP